MSTNKTSDAVETMILRKVNADCSCDSCSNYRKDAEAIAAKYKRMEEALRHYEHNDGREGSIFNNDPKPAREALAFDPLSSAA